MRRIAFVCATVAATAVVAFMLLVAAVVGGLSAGPGAAARSGPGIGGRPADAGSPALPAGWAGLEQAAAATCPGLPWPVLAAMGTVASDSGRVGPPGAGHGGTAAAAVGPFGITPQAYAVHATTGPGGAAPPTPEDPVDAAFTAAAALCDAGGGRPGGLGAAVAAAAGPGTSVRTVLVLATAYGDRPDISRAAAAALRFAAGALGTPYRWGGSSPDGYDCSGLVQAAYRWAGISLPRVAQDQEDAGPAVPDGQAVAPGDLVFFGTGPAAVTHVGLYLGSGLMIDAPHTGAVVRVDPAGGDGVVGVTRPA